MAGDFLLEDYKLKLDFLRHQYDRLWTRFHFFLSVELATFAFLGYLTFDKGYADATALPIAVGIGVSVLWYVVGAEDRALVEAYGTRARDAAKRLAQHPDAWAGYESDHAAAEIGRTWKGLRSWYFPPISMTRIPVTVAMILVIVWLGLSFKWKDYAGSYAASASKTAPVSAVDATAR